MDDGKLRRSEWDVRDISAKEAREFVIEHHYSKGCSNTRVYSHGLFCRGGNDLYGVAVWLPPTKVAAQSVNKEEWKKVLSLTRLACSPEAPKNAASFLMGSSIRLIKKDGRFVSLVTYADVRMSHTGAIYRATNWEYVGEMRGSPAWIDPNTGQQVAKKATTTRSKKEMEDLGYECIGTFGKHKFVMHLHKEGSAESR
jgi:hypothetical protein